MLTLTRSDRSAPALTAFVCAAAAWAWPGQSCGQCSKNVLVLTLSKFGQGKFEPIHVIVALHNSGLDRYFFSVACHIVSLSQPPSRSGAWPPMVLVFQSDCAIEQDKMHIKLGTGHLLASSVNILQFLCRPWSKVQTNILQ